ncbi:DUF1015 domain-containing protein [Hippea maritima]|uniref:Uncharacterized conserved protein UCP033563 n=1 Tax=Hippea maritima (strain ATCC 700847 / DSM 10411 / MH2) TaxID=760142 RepID=F2LW98_HIPMA|nr:DUF1015 domain-containing protein [Hippea maritima]AEA34032.1 Uncharacterized conserved protein UCP033563 [Hippea maritima DSM 10411]
MAQIYPFRGILYRQDLRDNSIMAPPYDVISKNYKAKLKKKSPYNVVKLTLPEVYENAKEFLNNWLNEGILGFDNNCCFYGYACDYEFNGKKRQLKGFLAALKLEEFGKHIRPHEKTLKGPKIDRFNLITTTNASFCPIMGLYDKSPEIKEELSKSLEEKPFFEATFENQLHRLFKISDSNSIKTMQDAFKDKIVIIADGHHRYETALMIKEHYNKQGLREGGFDYIMILLVEAEDGGLSLEAIHRLIKKLDEPERFKEKLKEYFYIKEGKDKNADFIMYIDKSFYSLTLKSEKPKGVLESLDSKIFEDIIYKEILGLTDEDIKNQIVSGYAHSEEETIELVDKKEAKVGFILKPMSFEQLVKITEEGLTVPQKSTFFYPKIPSGLVGYHFKSIEGCLNV